MSEVDQTSQRQSLSAAEVRERRRRKILEGSEQRMRKVLYGDQSDEPMQETQVNEEKKIVRNSEEAYACHGEALTRAALHSHTDVQNSISYEHRTADSIGDVSDKHCGNEHGHFSSTRTSQKVDSQVTRRITGREANFSDSRIDSDDRGLVREDEIIEDDESEQVTTGQKFSDYYRSLTLVLLALLVRALLNTSFCHLFLKNALIPFITLEVIFISCPDRLGLSSNAGAIPGLSMMFNLYASLFPQYIKPLHPFLLACMNVFDDFAVYMFTFILVNGLLSYLIGSISPMRTSVSRFIPRCY